MFLLNKYIMTKEDFPENLTTPAETEVAKKAALPAWATRLTRWVVAATTLLTAPLQAWDAKITSTGPEKRALTEAPLEKTKPSWFTDIQKLVVQVTADPDLLTISQTAAQSLPVFVRDLEQKMPQIEKEMADWRQAMAKELTKQIDIEYNALTAKISRASSIKDAKTEEWYSRQMILQDLLKNLKKPVVTNGDLKVAIAQCPSLQGWYTKERTNAQTRFTAKYFGTLWESVSRVAVIASQKKDPGLWKVLNELALRLRNPINMDAWDNNIEGTEVASLPYEIKPGKGIAPAVESGKITMSGKNITIMDANIGDWGSRIKWLPEKTELNFKLKLENGEIDATGMPGKDLALYVHQPAKWHNKETYKNVALWSDLKTVWQEIEGSFTIPEGAEVYFLMGQDRFKTTKWTTFSLSFTPGKEETTIAKNK